jgi:hypothetical protein
MNNILCHKDIYGHKHRNRHKHKNKNKNTVRVHCTQTQYTTLKWNPSCVTSIALYMMSCDGRRGTTHSLGEGELERGPEGRERISGINCTLASRLTFLALFLQLEWIVALELMEHPQSPVKCLLPIFVGQPRPNDNFPWDNLRRLPDTPSAKTANRAAKILKRLGVDEGQIERMKTKSIRSIVDDMLAYQGVQLSNSKDSDEIEMIRNCAARILQAVRTRVSVMASKVSNFVSVFPSGHEVIDWMQENAITEFLPIFARHNLHSLALVSKLGRQDAIDLFEEHSQMFNLKSKKPIKGDLMRLNYALDSLTNDPRTQSLTERLKTFTDTNGSVLTVLFSRNSIEAMFSDTVGARKVSISIMSLLLIALVQNQALSPLIWHNLLSPDEESIKNFKRVEYSFWFNYFGYSIPIVMFVASILAMLIMGARLRWSLPAKTSFLARGFFLILAVNVFPLKTVFHWYGLYNDFFAARDYCYNGNVAHFETLNHTEVFNTGKKHAYPDPLHDQLHNCSYLTTSDPPRILDLYDNLINVEYSLLGLSMWVVSGMLYYRQEYFFITYCVAMALMFCFYLFRSGGGFQPVYATFTFTLSLLLVSIILAKVCLCRLPLMPFASQKALILH